MPSLKQNKEIPPEIAFSLKNILREIRINRTVLIKNYSNKINLIMKMIDHQNRLNGIYTRECMVKRRLGLKYEHNVLLANTLFNQTYLSLSILILLKQTLYGSARILLRQFFEALLIAKYSEQDASLTEKWKANVEGKTNIKRISVNVDVLSKLEKKGIDVSELRKTWKLLNLFVHSTPQAQQILRVPIVERDSDGKEVEKWRESSYLMPNVEYTLDLLFLLLCMNFHLLISHLGRKARGYYFGYSKGPLNFYKRTKSLKNRHKLLVDKYFETNKKNRGINKLLKRNIWQYRQNWIK